MWELLIAFAIVAVCVLVHIAGIVLLAQFLIARFPEVENITTVSRQGGLLIIIFAVLIVLHLLEIGTWATFYYFRNLFPDYETSFYFSLGTYSTIGYGDVVLPQRWRLLGGIEGISGVLLCGLSGAFIFAVVNVLFQARMSKKNLRR